jgi:hypothetical protein
MAYEMAEIRNNEPLDIQKIKPINDNIRTKII